MSNIETAIKNAVAEQLGVGVDEINNDSSFVDDLGADSLDLVELVMAFEQEFDVNIPDEDTASLVTVQNAIDYINAKL